MGGLIKFVIGLNISEESGITESTNYNFGKKIELIGIILYLLKKY